MAPTILPLFVSLIGLLPQIASLAAAEPSHFSWRPTPTQTLTTTSTLTRTGTCSSVPSAPCPAVAACAFGTTCIPQLPDCNGCVGVRVYQRCGGNPPMGSTPCPSGHVCIEDPFRTGCGMNCDAEGFCVEPIPCGGSSGTLCPGRMRCLGEIPGPNTCKPAEIAGCLGYCV
jgi:hypothetical protein